jgi:quaternary ammonium compound-resistance protein SugE
MSLSGALLWLAQKTIPIGTAYAVWTGIGSVGTLLVGIAFFGDSASIWRMLSALLIVIGIVGLKLAH